MKLSRRLAMTAATGSALSALALSGARANGEPSVGLFEGLEEFWLATIDYLAAGGDNLAHVFSGIPLSRRKYFQVGPRDLMAEYLRKHPGIELPRQDVVRLNARKN